MNLSQMELEQAGVEIRRLPGDAAAHLSKFMIVVGDENALDIPFASKSGKTLEAIVLAQHYLVKEREAEFRFLWDKGVPESLRREEKRKAPRLH
jgi:hypothetical protein